MNTIDTSRGLKANGFFGRTLEKVARYRVYRTTFDELSSLGDRELVDLGIARADVRRIAYMAAFGS